MSTSPPKLISNKRTRILVRQELGRWMALGHRDNIIAEGEDPVDVLQKAVDYAKTIGGAEIVVDEIIDSKDTTKTILVEDAENIELKGTIRTLLSKVKLVIRNSTNIIVRNIRVSDVDVGITIEDSEGVKTYNTNFENITGYAVLVRNSPRTKIVDTYMMSGTGKVLRIENTSTEDLYDVIVENIYGKVDDDKDYAIEVVAQNGNIEALQLVNARVEWVPTNSPNTYRTAVLLHGASANASVRYATIRDIYVRNGGSENRIAQLTGNVVDVFIWNDAVITGKVYCVQDPETSLAPQRIRSNIPLTGTGNDLLYIGYKFGLTYKQALTPEIGLNNNYGAPARTTIEEGTRGIAVMGGLISISGLDTSAGETIYLTFKFIYSDGSTQEYIDLPFTENGNYRLTEQALQELWKSGAFITAVEVQAKTNLSSTNATVTVSIRGFQA